MLSRGTDVGYLAERFPHPRDARVRFEEGPHLYYIDGKVVGKSVTGLLKMVENDSFDADAIALRKSLVPCARYNAGVDADTGMYVPLSVDTIKGMWDQARDLGTDLHARIENHLNRRPVHFTSSENVAEFRQALQWIATSGLEPFRTEWVIFDEAADVAGSVDFVARDPTTGDLVIIDWKRCRHGEEVYQFCKRRDGKRLKPPLDHMLDTTLSHWAAQVNLYRVILERNYGVKISKMQMVCLYEGQEEAHVYVHDRDDRVQELLYGGGGAVPCV